MMFSSASFGCDQVLFLSGLGNGQSIRKPFLGIDSVAWVVYDVD
jgi:hypothetical protein